MSNKIQNTPPFIHESAVVDEGAVLGAGVRVWHFCHVMSGARLGTGSSLGQNSFVGKGVVIGENCKVQNNVSLYEGVTLGDDVFLGPSCVFTNVINPRSAVNRRNAYAPTDVQDGASIGANATILCGTTIGKHAFVGAGAVVLHDVPPYAIVVGNPARQTGWMSPHGCRLDFSRPADDGSSSDGDGIAICPESGEKFKLTSNGDSSEDHVQRID